MQTWELVYQAIKKYQPVKGVELEEYTGLTKGQIASGLRILRTKKMVKQSKNKAYLAREKDVYDDFVKDIKEVLERFPFPKDDDSDKYKELYKKISEYVK